MTINNNISDSFNGTNFNGSTNIMGNQTISLHSLEEIRKLIEGLLEGVNHKIKDPKEKEECTSIINDLETHLKNKKWDLAKKFFKKLPFAIQTISAGVALIKAIEQVL